MALRLRRGTDAERQLITPVAGELIYTTDTKLLYVGDGSTVGGTLVTGAGGGSTTLDALTDTDLTGAADGEVLTFVSGTNKWEPVSIAALSNVTLDALTDTDLTGEIDSDVLSYNGLTSKWEPINVEDLISGTGIQASLTILADDLTVMVNPDTKSFNGALTGEFKGSVFGDDSSILVDGINGTIVGVVENDYTSAVEYVQGANVRIGSAVGGGNLIVLRDNVDSSLLVLTTEDPAGQVISVRPLQVGSTSALVGDGKINIVTSTANALGMTLVGSFDGADNTLSAIHRSRGTKAAPTAIQNGDGLGSFILTGYNGAGYRIAGGIKATVSGTPQAAHIPANVELYVGNAGGAADVVLRAKYDQKVTELLGPLKLVPFTTAERNALTPEEGMVIFNTDTTIAQVYANSAWRDMNVAA